MTPQESSQDRQSEQKSSHVFLSSHIVDDFHKRLEQETLLNLRRHAIARWLKQLPVEETCQKRTMWTNFHSFAELDDSVECGSQNRDLRGYEAEVFFEESPLDAIEKKSMPFDNECPIRSLDSIKITNRDSSKNLMDSADVGFENQFSKKWKMAEMSSSLHNDRQSYSFENMESTGGDMDWSVMSDCVGAPSQIGDTAYGGSAYGSRKHFSIDRFRSKYKISHPMTSPPTSQCIERLQSTKEEASGESEAKAPEGEWWIPNVVFKGLVEMITGPTDATTNESPPQTITKRLSKPSCSMERVLHRLRSRQRLQRRLTSVRYPSISRLHSRMQRAHKQRKCFAIRCKLEHPLKMKTMAASEFPLHPNTLSKKPNQDYIPPASITDLSDFECYLGPMWSTFAPVTQIQHPAVGHCQTWVLEKLICLLGVKIGSFMDAF